MLIKDHGLLNAMVRLQIFRCVPIYANKIVSACRAVDDRAIMGSGAQIKLIEVLEVREEMELPAAFAAMSQI